MVPKLGWFEWLFVTPSNHRVHHAKNRRSIWIKITVAFFIIWDRLFGTFIEEDKTYDPIRYGTLKPLRSWNPLMGEYAGLFRNDSGCGLHTAQPGKKDFSLWFRKTGYQAKRYRYAPMKMPDIYAYQDYNPQISSRPERSTHWLQFVATALVMTTVSGGD